MKVNAAGVRQKSLEKHNKPEAKGPSGRKNGKVSSKYQRRRLNANEQVVNKQIVCLLRCHWGPYLQSARKHTLVHVHTHAARALRVEITVVNWSYFLFLFALCQASHPAATEECR